MRFGGRQVPVPDEFMVPLLKIGSGLPVEEDLFKSGEQVRLEGGPFAGLLAVFDLPKGEDRAQVLLEVLGTARPLTVPIDDLSRLS